jgi:hypothetical protein
MLLYNVHVFKNTKLLSILRHAFVVETLLLTCGHVTENLPNDFRAL